jgi:hypothetical protein
MDTDTALYESSVWLGLISSALVFGLSAMAWQRLPYRAILLLALASMVTLLIQVMDVVAAHRFPDPLSYQKYFRCRTVFYWMDCVLYPWSIIELFKLLHSQRPSGLRMNQQ